MRAGLPTISAILAWRLRPSLCEISENTSMGIAKATRTIDGPAYTSPSMASVTILTDDVMQRATYRSRVYQSPVLPLHQT